MAFESGALVGDYVVLGPIGAGGMGTVYKVRNSVSDRVEAMKVLLPSLKAAPHLEERFLREIRILGRLQHPNIAGLHTAFRQNDQLLMIMEFIEGQALPQILRTNRPAIPVCMNYATQTLSAVAYAHGMGVIHRDIKPSNIMVNTHGIVKLLDFGIASVAADKKLTRTGMVMGSLHYMSPEQVQAQPADARSDVYSLGATLYELFTGRCPLEGDSDWALMNAHLRTTPLPAAQVDARVPAEISTALMKALEKEPANRYSSAAEFLAALQGAGRGEPVESMTRTIAAHAPAAAPATPASRPSVPVNPAALEDVTKQLAQYIGPIAKVVVKKAAARTDTMGKLCEAVAEEIADPRERAKFLAAARRIKTGSTNPG